MVPSVSLDTETLVELYYDIIKKENDGHSPVHDGRGRSAHQEQASHWHLTIFSRLTIWAGFEFATGIPVNPMPPQEAAKFLKG